MNIRTATQDDKAGVRAVHLVAFPEGEREIIAKLAVNLLAEKTIPATISLVAEVADILVGNVVFSPVTISNNSLQGYILAPLAVRPEYQKQMIGSQLIESGMDTLRAAGVNVLFVYGDPAYYGRFGFTAHTGAKFTAPYPLQYPFGWQAALLHRADDLILPAKLSCVASLYDPRLW